MLISTTMGKTKQQKEPRPHMPHRRIGVWSLCRAHEQQAEYFLSNDLTDLDKVGMVGVS